MKNGVDVIVQGRLALNCFSGYSDFLVKIEGRSQLGEFHYEIWDTKLASQVKPTFIIQLCCYSEMIEAIQGRLPEYMTLAYSKGTQERFKTINYYYYYRSLKSAFIETQRSFQSTQIPDPAESTNWGDWSGYAEQLFVSKDHLFQVATITKSQIKKLNQADILTMNQLALTEQESIDGINSTTLQRLKAQASIQIQSQQLQADQPNTPPCFKILKPSDNERAGLALLPPHSALDVFFDIEGYPLDNGGLEYLWGATFYTADGTREFIDFWAHNRQQEKKPSKSLFNGSIAAGNKTLPCIFITMQTMKLLPAENSWADLAYVNMKSINY